MSTAWHGDWKQRLRGRLRDLGYKTLTDCLRDAPTIPYLLIADRLGKEDVAAFQVEWLQYEEAVTGGNLREAAMDSLARDITHHLPNGWKAETKGDFQTSGVWTDWVVRLEECANEIRPVARSVWNTLLEGRPPVGWKPSGPDDPYLIAAFEKSWPLGIAVQTKIVPRPGDKVPNASLEKD